MILKYPNCTRNVSQCTDATLTSIEFLTENYWEMYVGVNRVTCQRSNLNIYRWPYDNTKFSLYTCTEVMEPFLVVVILSCIVPMSVAKVGW